MKRTFFGTDGIRGPYGGPVVNESFFSRLGAAAALWLAKRHRTGAKVYIGRDTRASGASLADALGTGVMAAGAQPLYVGVVPTPAISRAVSHGSAGLGAVITASHNPASDNGVKFFGPDGSKLTDAEEAALEKLIIGTVVPPIAIELAAESVLESYVEAATRILSPGALRGWRVALDTANGATCATSPAVFAALGAQVLGLGDKPDGLNINRAVGSEHPEGLARLVMEGGASFGVAHDGDGDRCILCDEKGGVLDGDEVLAILATHALRKGTLASRTLVVTVQSNLGLDRAVRQAGGKVVRTDVGDRYVAERMRVEGATLGGESSGHILSFDLSPTGDGLSAALKVAGVMAETGRPLSELRKVMQKFPQRTAALEVHHKKPIESLSGLQSAIRGLEASLGSEGRVLVRYSGTEPKLRFLVEGPTAAAVADGIGRLVYAARAELDAH
ncbi:MAG TPA: phosphoglucosamine mutase [Opitutaceae bacterium]|jgi:phosphoglucosamine mutase